MAKGRVEKHQNSKRHKSGKHEMSKLDRKNQARQRQLLKQQQQTQSTKVFAGQHGAPRVVAIVPLCEDIKATDAVRKLNGAIGVDVPIPAEGSCTTRIERFKQSVQYILCSRRLFETLDACKTADYVMFVLSASHEVDSAGEMLLRSIENQGVSNIITVVSGLDSIVFPKTKQAVSESLKSYISHFLPQQEKVHSLDTPQECSNVIRSFCSSVPKGIVWREDRCWMVVDEVGWAGDATLDTSSAVLTGFVRGSGLSANRLLQVGDWGAFQIEKVTSAPLASNLKQKAEEMAVDDAEEPIVLATPDSNQDDLAEVAPEEITMEDIGTMDMSRVTGEPKGVLLDNEHYFSDEDMRPSKAPRKLPRGTSSYQAAWYLDDMSDSGSDWEDQADQNGKVQTGPVPLLGNDDEVLDDIAPNEPTEGNASEYPQSEMFLDPAPQDEVEEITAYRSSRKKEAAEDLEFPDEIELHPNVLARERLARYRGLKSFKTSQWETTPDRPYEPEVWNRLLQVPHYSSAKKRAIKESLDAVVAAGTKVKIHLRNVPISLKNSMSPFAPLAAFSLHRHEQKRTVMNLSITLDSEHEGSIKSKEQLLMQCGPRRFLINPIFSAPGVTTNDVHKYDRYLHPGRTAVATVIAPLTWGTTPTLFFQQSAASTDAGASEPSQALLKLVATGTTMAPSSSRVIAKRVILTGHPYKIHKRLVTVRYMFFNAEDVHWFRALRLWTRRGRSGFVKESLGTHGYFKATFDGRISPQDAVAMSLYKRMWPRPARAWRGEEGVTNGRVMEVEMASGA